MRRVTSLDAAMLYAEAPEMPMHTRGVVILEPSPDERPFQVLRRVFEERMHLLAPLRRRLVQGPLKLGDPHWIEDPSFDLDSHLRRAAIPSPGSMYELSEFVGDSAGRLLERTRPLWEVVVVEGVEGERVAIVAKVHHAAMDGGQVVARLLGCLFDPTPEGRAVPPPGESWTPDREPSLAWFAGPLRAAALAVFAIGQAVALWAARSNRFFSDFVRIQTERGHHVVDTGPYAFVRHPGYAAGIPAYLAVPIFLGSAWGVVPALLGGMLLVLRTAREDRILHAKLPGYREYAARVRWRLLPRVW